MTREQIIQLRDKIDGHIQAAQDAVDDVLSASDADSLTNAVVEALKAGKTFRETAREACAVAVEESSRDARRAARAATKA